VRIISKRGSVTIGLVPLELLLLLFSPFFRIVYFKAPISSISFNLAEKFQPNLQLPEEVLLLNGNSGAY
jgi:hypothetical protein